MKFPESTSDENIGDSQNGTNLTPNNKKNDNAIIDIDAELDTTDLFLNHETKFKHRLQPRRLYPRLTWKA